VVLVLPRRTDNYCVLDGISIRKRRLGVELGKLSSLTVPSQQLLSSCYEGAIELIMLTASKAESVVVSSVRLFVCPVGILTMTHQGAAWDAASVHFVPIVRRTDIHVFVLCLAVLPCNDDNDDTMRGYGWLLKGDMQRFFYQID